MWQMDICGYIPRGDIYNIKDMFNNTDSILAESSDSEKINLWISMMVNSTGHYEHINFNYLESDLGRIAYNFKDVMLTVTAVKDNIECTMKVENGKLNRFKRTY
jgi:hypothetical protein